MDHRLRDTGRKPDLSSAVHRFGLTPASPDMSAKVAPEDHGGAA